MRATSISSCARGRARPSRSACWSTAKRPAQPTGWTSKRRAGERWSSHGSISWCASPGRLRTARSRSHSSIRASRRTCSPSASQGFGSPGMVGAPTFRLEPPRLRTTEGGMERHATWFELYFDLVFAAAIFELATGLADDPSAAVFARFAGLFVAVLLAWTHFTVYANRFDTDDLIYRLAKAAAALALAAIAIEIPRVLAGDG